MHSMTKMMKSGMAAVVAGAFACAASEATASLIANPGFEDPVTTDGPPFVGSWEAFVGSGFASSFNSSANPRSGAQHLELAISATINSFAGVFQDVPGLTSGEIINFSGWARDVGLDAGGSEIRIEWRDSVGNTEVARTPNLVPALTDEYTLWSVVDTVPAGADSARVVYAIQSFGAGPDQNVYVDDISVTVIPEPASLTLLGLGGLLLVGSRRRKI